MNIGLMISQSGLNSLGLGKLLLEGVQADRFARLATGKDGPIETNHPAFVYGHLALYPAAFCKLLGDEQCASEVAAPESWNGIFGAGQTCKDDPDGSIYPPMQEVVDQFESSHQKLLALIGRTPDDVFLKDNPNEGLRDRLGLKTVGAGVNFMMTSHVMMHLGQVSAWRRIEGLGAAMNF